MRPRAMDLADSCTVWSAHVSQIGQIPAPLGLLTEVAEGNALQQGLRITCIGETPGDSTDPTDI
jgi:hypothetical protein